MGDRGAIAIRTEADQPLLIFYTHWNGYKLADVLQSGLKRGEPRWGDDSYLARILFCELVKDDINSETGYGIAAFKPDAIGPVSSKFDQPFGIEYNLLVVDTAKQQVTVQLGDQILSTWTFQQFIKLDTGTLNDVYRGAEPAEV